MSRLLSRLLELEGFETLALSPVDDVPARARDESPDVLLLDVYLGGQNGLEILEALRARESTRRLPVVMMSGRNVEYECLCRGAFAFLLKPFFAADLIRALQAAIVPQGS